MSSLKTIVFMLLCCMVATSSLADIYAWTDENGVKHYSNYAPADKSEVLMKTKEEPYDEAADRARMEFERRERLELARLELARREAEVELREAEAKRKLAEAEHVAREMLREADDYYDEAITGSRIIYRGGGYRCRDYYYGCNYPVHHRWYYRKKYPGGPHDKYSRPQARQHHRYGNQKYTGFEKRDYDHRYRSHTRRPHENGAKFKLNARPATNYRLNRIGSSRAGLSGRGNLSWRGSRFGRRQ